MNSNTEISGTIDKEENDILNFTGAMIFTDEESRYSLFGFGMSTIISITIGCTFYKE